MHFTRIINLQCARIWQTIVNETSSGEKNRSSQKEILRIRLARKKIIHPRLILHRINCRIIRAELKIFGKKGIQEQSRKIKKIKKNVQLKKKGQNSFTPINYDNCSSPFYSFEASAPNSYPHEQYNKTYTYIILTIMNTYEAKNVLF